MSRIIDISQPVSPEIAVWPGDTRFDSFWVMRMANNDSVNVGSVTMSLHTGSHADAPLHFKNTGASIAECDLSAYIGNVVVVDLSDSIREDNNYAITEELLKPLLSQKAERLLVKTGTGSMKTFPERFAHFSAGAARLLADMNLKLIGIDTPSVDFVDSKKLEAHHIFGSAEIRILENLVLENVFAGSYELIALPLKLTGMDASPVRAILRTIDQ